MCNILAALGRQGAHKSEIYQISEIDSVLMADVLHLCRYICVGAASIVHVSLDGVYQRRTDLQ